ncbi:putative glutamate receptor [Amblyomma americanum]
MGQYLCYPQGSPANEDDVEAQLVRSEAPNADTAHSQFQLSAGFGTSECGPPQATASNGAPRRGPPASPDSMAEAHRHSGEARTNEGATSPSVSSDKDAKNATGRTTTLPGASQSTSRQQKRGAASGHSGEPQAPGGATSILKSAHRAPAAKRSHRDTATKSRAAETQQQGSMQGSHGITGTREPGYAPYHLIDTPGFNVDVRGVCGEILKAIAVSLRTNYSVAFPPDSYWGLLKPDGNWTGVLGMLQRDEADIALAAINPTSEKKDVAVETETVLPIELMILAGRLSKHQSNVFGIIQVLTWEVWLLFACSMGLSALLWSLSDWAHWRAAGDSSRCSLLTRAFRRHFWSFVESSLLEASPSTPKRVSARIVVGSFWLLVIVVTTVVAGQMKAMMMVREEADRIDSMRHLAARPAMKPYTIAGSAGVSSVRDSKDPDYQKVWRMMQKHKADQPTSVVLADKTMREVVTGKAVLILSRASVAARATAACASFKRGEFYLAREPMFKFNSVFYLSKRLSADRRRDINNRILWLRETGLIAKWWEESSGNWEGCGQATSNGRLTFADFQDLLLFWLAMLGAATVVFLLECASGLLCSRRGAGKSLITIFRPLQHSHVGRGEPTTG